MKIRKPYDRHSAQDIYDVFMILLQLIINAHIKNLISLKNITPPPHLRKLQPPPALAPAPLIV